MEFGSVRYADAVVAIPVGRVDHASAPRLESALEPMQDDAAIAAIVLDFAGVPYVSSVGLRVLMVASKKLRARGAAIGVAALQPVVQEIFDISRFDHVVQVYPSVREALAAMSPAALAAFQPSAAAPPR